jgi:hypothetical protein
MSFLQVGNVSLYYWEDSPAIILRFIQLHFLSLGSGGPLFFFFLFFSFILPAISFLSAMKSHVVRDGGGGPEGRKEVEEGSYIVRPALCKRENWQPNS